MAVEMDTETFLDALRRSGLAADDQVLALLVDERRTRPDDPRALADELVRREVLTAWQADMLLRGKARGFQIGPYRILRPLGHGGMGNVFLAEHGMMHRLSAIKVLPGRYQEDPDLLQRFHLEARAVAALDHPHIVRAYDFNKDVRNGAEVYYLVMEYVEGRDLQHTVDEQGQMDCRKAADLIRQAALGLAHAHEAGFVHRDIKPANLLVDNNGVLKILDLGLARFAFEVERASHASAAAQPAMGTPDYMAPEQVVGSLDLDGRADIYSLGHTFYFLLVGRRPFVKGSLPELLMAHRTEEPEPICVLRPDVPFELSEIIEKMTAKAPAARYQTAKEVGDVLDAWLREAASARPPSRMAALKSAAMRSKHQAQGEQPRPQTRTAKDAELELAPLPDRPAGDPVSTVGAQAETRRLRASHADTSRGDAAASSRAAATPVPAKAVVNRQGPAQGSTTKTPSSGQATLFSGGPRSAVGSLPSAAYPMACAAPRASRGVLSSPWFWMGSGGVFLAVLLLIVLNFPSSTTREEGPTVAARPSTEPSSLPEQLAPPAGAKPAQPRSVEMPPNRGPQRPAHLPENSHDASREDPPLPKKEVAVAPPPAAEPENPPAPASDPLVDIVAPKLAAPETPSKTDKPDAANKVAAEELLARVTAMSFHLQSADPVPNSKVNLLIQRQALEAAKRIGITALEGAPAVMELQLDLNEGADAVALVLSAELKIPDQGGQAATAWKASKEVASLSPQALNHAATLTIIRKGVSEFFSQFVDDVRRAREEKGKR